MSKQSKDEWVSGWNGGKSGPTCPSCSGATVAGGNWGIVPVGPGRRTVAIVVQQDHECGAAEMEANAHLIAAAPELYEALIQLIDDLSNTDEEGLFEHSETVIRCRLALSKARGEI